MSTRPDVAGPSGKRGWDYTVIRERVTAERLHSYVVSTGFDLERAFELYEWNMRASAGVLTTSAMVEVVVRNALDRQLVGWTSRRGQGCSWFDVAPLDARGRADIDQARQRATVRGRVREIHGKVIAELPLGFWRYLVTSRYLTALWTPACTRRSRTVQGTSCSASALPNTISSASHSPVTELRTTSRFIDGTWPGTSRRPWSLWAGSAHTPRHGSRRGRHWSS